MANQKVRSARGTVVDFDLIKVKQTIGKKPKAVNVEAREEFIERKMRRRLRHNKSQNRVVPDAPVVAPADKPKTRQLKKKTKDA